MKKILTHSLVLLISISMVITLSLIGCKEEASSAEEVEEGVVEEAEPAEKVEEQAPAKEAAPVELRMTLNADWAITFEELVQEFEKENPGIRIVLDVAGDLIQYKETLPQIFASDDKPDIACYWVELNSGYPIMLKNDLMEPLDDIYKEHNFEELIPEAAVDLYKNFGHTDGSYYAVPLSSEFVGMIYYNKKIFEEVGIEAPEFSYTTLDEFYDMSDRLSKAGYEPLTAGLLEGWIIGHIRDILFQRNIPQEKLDDLRWNWIEGSEPKYHFTDPDVLSAHKMMVEWGDRLFVEGSLARSYAEGRSLFIQGNAAMYEDGSWGSTSIINEAPEDFEFGVFIAPQVRNDVEPKMIIYLGSALMIPRGSETADIAKKFVSYVISKGGNTIIAKNGFVPVRNDLDISIIKEQLGYYTGGLVELSQKIGTSYIYDSCLTAEFANKSFTLLQDMLAGKTSPEDVGKEMENIAENLRKGE